MLQICNVKSGCAKVDPYWYIHFWRYIFGCAKGSISIVYWRHNGRMNILYFQMDTSLVHFSLARTCIYIYFNSHFGCLTLIGDIIVEVEADLCFKPSAYKKGPCFSSSSCVVDCKKEGIQYSMCYPFKCFCLYPC